MTEVFISIGSNIEPEKNIRKALDLLRRRVRITGVSTFYRSGALGRPDQPQFYNGVIRLETDIPSEELKYSVLRKIEDETGRVRSEDKYAPRTIDLDILIYGGCVIESASITVPDPDIIDRPFLAIPLFELAPDMIIPGTGKSIRRISAVLGCEHMTPLNEFTQEIREDLRYES